MHGVALFLRLGFLMRKIGIIILIWGLAVGGVSNETVDVKHLAQCLA